MDVIFTDTIETGGLSAWSANADNGGDLSVSASAAVGGAHGLQAVLDDNNAIHVSNGTPFADKRYRARFYFDPNSIVMTFGDAHYLFYPCQGETTVVARLEFRRYFGNNQIRSALINDASAWTNTPWQTISDASHYFEIDWTASSGPLANDGGLALWIDGVQKAALTGIDNNTRTVDFVRFGAVSGIDTGTRGTYYFDAFASVRSSYLGQYYDGTTASFVYDGDGNRVKSTINGVTTVYIGDRYELRSDGEGETTRLYYYAGSQRIAVGENGTLSWLLSDHLGSTSLVTTSDAALSAEFRYKAFGETRYAAGISPTDYRYTGQRVEDLLGLYFYRARWYDPALGRFISPDSLVPAIGKAQSVDRYAYVFNSPLNYIDPSGERGGASWLLADLGMMFAGASMTLSTDTRPLQADEAPSDAQGAMGAALFFGGPVVASAPALAPTAAFWATEAYRLSQTHFGRAALEGTVEACTVGTCTPGEIAGATAQNLLLDAPLTIGQRTPNSEAIPDEAFVHISPTKYDEAISAHGLNPPGGEVYFGRWRDFSRRTIAQAEFDYKIEPPGRWTEEPGLTAWVLGEGSGIKPTYCGAARVPGGPPQWVFRGSISPASLVRYTID